MLSGLGDFETGRVVGGTTGDDFNGVVTALFGGGRDRPGVGTGVGGGGGDGGDVVEVVGVGASAEVEGYGGAMGGSPVVEVLVEDSRLKMHDSGQSPWGEANVACESDAIIMRQKRYAVTGVRHGQLLANVVVLRMNQTSSCGIQDYIANGASLRGRNTAPSTAEEYENIADSKRE